MLSMRLAAGTVSGLSFVLVEFQYSWASRPARSWTVRDWVDSSWYCPGFHSVASAFRPWMAAQVLVATTAISRVFLLAALGSVGISKTSKTPGIALALAASKRSR